MFALIFLFATAQLNAQKSSIPNWRINAGIGYGTYYGDLSHYRIKNLSDWKNLKYFLKYNKNYVLNPSFHLSLEKKFSNRSGVIFSGNYTDIAMSDRYLSSDGKLNMSNANFNRALNFRSKIYDVGVGYKLKSNEKAFIAPYLWLGGGVSFFNATGDLYDAAGTAYNYASPNVATDGRYETALRDQLTETDAKYRNVAPYANVGLGLAVKLSKAFAIGVESDIKYSFSDYIDDASGTYKAAYATQQQAYAARPGTNVSNPVNSVRGNNDKVNDFYIQNRLVLKYNFFAITKKTKSARSSFKAPVIYPSYYGASDKSSIATNADTTIRDSVLVKNGNRQSGKLDSVVENQNREISRLHQNVDSLRNRVDTLDEKLKGVEQRARVNAVNAKLDSLQQLMNSIDRKPRRTTVDSLRRHVYQLQADSIVNDATRAGIERNKLHTTSAYNASKNEPLYESKSIVQNTPADIKISEQQKQLDSLSNLTVTEANAQNRRADSIQQKMDSLVRVQERLAADTASKMAANSMPQKDTVVVSRTVTVKDTIAQQRLDALNDKLERLYNSNDSVKNELDYLQLQRDATQIKITNDSLRLQVLRQQRDGDPEITGQPKRKWYEVFKKKDKSVKRSTQKQDRNDLEINRLEREMNDLRTRNSQLERQLQNTPQVVERYYETDRDNNTAERRRYADLRDELRDLNRQLGRERRYANIYPAVPVQQSDNSVLQREIDQLRNELQQLKTPEVRNVPPPAADTTIVQPDINAAKLDQMTQAVESLNRELAALKRQANQPAPAKPETGITSIYFNSGSATASAAQRVKLAVLRTAVGGGENTRIELKAFTDATGNINVNETLSRKRAAYVKAYLVQHHKIPEENITVTVNPSSKAAGGVPNPLDRRVDVIITADK